jgi:hypothetical protein
MMPNAVPNPNYSNHNSLFPANATDLVSSIANAEASILPPAQEPPITRHVSVPEKVSVKYIAELTGQPRYAVTSLMNQLGVSQDRSIAFEDAAEILRRYGIAAERMM